MSTPTAGAAPRNGSAAPPKKAARGLAPPKPKAARGLAPPKPKAKAGSIRAPECWIRDRDPMPVQCLPQALAEFTADFPLLLRHSLQADPELHRPLGEADHAVYLRGLEHNRREL